MSDTAIVLASRVLEVMKITKVASWSRHVALKRPYTIATGTIDAVELLFVRLHTDAGVCGIGSASPAPDVTGETVAACAKALAPAALGWLAARDARHVGGLCRELERELGATPAARAALDMAAFDLVAQHLGVPVVELLGRCHDRLPTSITIGIRSVEETLAEANEHLGRGFSCLKVKIGLDLDTDIERLRHLRERIDPGIRIRVDANQGYSRAQTLRLWEQTQQLDIELLEQPLPAAAIDEMRSLPAQLRGSIAADESLLTPEHAWRLAQEPQACGIFNIKLMKCGGITPALRIAAIAEHSGSALMWGCMDESVLSISAALHAALACPSTRYLDLDGSFDLASDPCRGGFRLEGGALATLDAPGLGVGVETAEA